MGFFSDIVDSVTSWVEHPSKAASNALDSITDPIANLSKSIIGGTATKAVGSVTSALGGVFDSFINKVVNTVTVPVSNSVNASINLATNLGKSIVNDPVGTLGTVISTMTGSPVPQQVAGWMNNPDSILAGSRSVSNVGDFTTLLVDRGWNETTIKKLWDGGVRQIPVPQNAIDAVLAGLPIPPAPSMPPVPSKLTIPGWDSILTATDIIGITNPTPALAPGGEVMTTTPSHLPTVATKIGSAVDRYGRPVHISPAAQVVPRLPKGYVMVNDPILGRVGMLKGAAIATGLYRSKPKPPISAADWRHLRIAERVRKKTRVVARKAGWAVTTRGRSSSRTPVRRTRK